LGCFVSPTRDIVYRPVSSASPSRTFAWFERIENGHRAGFYKNRAHEPIEHWLCPRGSAQRSAKRSSPSTTRRRQQQEARLLNLSRRRHRYRITRGAQTPKKLFETFRKAIMLSTVVRRVATPAVARSGELLRCEFWICCVGQPKRNPSYPLLPTKKRRHRCQRTTDGLNYVCPERDRKGGMPCVAFLTISLCI
jgi:hypothetical protein